MMLVLTRLRPAWLKWPWRALFVFGGYATVIWLLNADLFGVHLSVHLPEFWYSVEVITTYVALIGLFVLVPFLVIAHAVVWMRRRK